MTSFPFPVRSPRNITLAGSDHTVTCVSAEGEGMACGGLPFLGNGCPIPDVDYLCLLCIDFYVWDAVSNFNHLPGMFLSTDFAFRITD